MGSIAMSYSMMSACLLDDEFYAACPWMAAVRQPAQRSLASRKALFDRVNSNKGCTGCTKRRAERERKKMETEHGLLFSAMIASAMKSSAQDFADLKKYVTKKLQDAGGNTEVTRIQMYTVEKSENSGKKEAVLLEI